MNSEFEKIVIPRCFIVHIIQNLHQSICKLKLNAQFEKKLLFRDVLLCIIIIHKFLHNLNGLIMSL